MAMKKVWEDYSNEIQKILQKENSTYRVLGISGEWQGANTKLRCECGVHGVWESTTIHKFKSGRRCPKCKGYRGLTIETIKENIINTPLHGSVFTGFVGGFSGVSTLAQFNCEKHGLWESTYANFMSGSRCRSCAIAKSLSKGDEYFIKKLNLVNKENPNFSITGVTRTETSKNLFVEVHCLKCKGTETRAYPSLIKAPYVCKGCIILTRNLQLKAITESRVSYVTRIEKKKTPRKITRKYDEEASERMFLQKLSEKFSTGDVRFLGWAGEYSGNSSRIRLWSQEFGEWESSASVALYNKTPKSPNRFPLDRHVKDFMSTGKFLEGTVFERREGGKYSYYCPKCSEDEFVKAGVCNGVFSSTSWKLKGSQELPCRCSRGYRYTPEQVKYLIDKRLKESDSLSFVEWGCDAKDVNKSQRFTFSCRKHGETNTLISNFLYQQTGCPGCAGKTQTLCYINQVRDNDTFPVAIKLGITKNEKTRLMQQNRKNLFKMECLGVWKFAATRQCKEAEAECKKSLSTGVLSAREMIDGWSETVSILDLERVIAIYEKHGGVRIK